MINRLPLFFLAFAGLLLLACSSVELLPEEPREEHNLTEAALPTVVSPVSAAVTTIVPTASSQSAGGTVVPDNSSNDIWRPPPQTSWQWQLTGLPVDQSFDVVMYDIDLFETDSSIVKELQAQGRKVICYTNAGGWENWRPDADRFPEGIIGENLDDWAGERWLDIRRLDELAPIMEERMDQCQQKGFDGIEPDNVDGFLNDTGFPLTYDDQLRYNIWLSDTAHERGLSIGLKNDMDQIPDLLPHFDWALNEECFEFNECETLLPFIEAGLAVFNAEYGLETDAFCSRAKVMRFSSLKKNLNLDAWQEACD